MSVPRSPQPWRTLGWGPTALSNSPSPSFSLHPPLFLENVNIKREARSLPSQPFIQNIRDRAILIGSRSPKQCECTQKVECEQSLDCNGKHFIDSLTLSWRFSSSATTAQPSTSSGTSLEVLAMKVTPWMQSQRPKPYLLYSVFSDGTWGRWYWCWSVTTLMFHNPKSQYQLNSYCCWLSCKHLWSLEPLPFGWCQGKIVFVWLTLFHDKVWTYLVVKMLQHCHRVCDLPLAPPAGSLWMHNFNKPNIH